MRRETNRQSEMAACHGCVNMLIEVAISSALFIGAVGAVMLPLL